MLLRGQSLPPRPAHPCAAASALVPRKEEGPGQGHLQPEARRPNSTLPLSISHRQPTWDTQADRHRARTLTRRPRAVREPGPRETPCRRPPAHGVRFSSCRQEQAGYAQLEGKVPGLYVCHMGCDIGGTTPARRRYHDAFRPCPLHPQENGCWKAEELPQNGSASFSPFMADQQRLNAQRQLCCPFWWLTCPAHSGEHSVGKGTCSEQESWPVSVLRLRSPQAPSRV